MKLSIITVTYNSEQFLEEAIESVKNQSCKDYEYIIIDGGSTDKTLEIIKKYYNEGVVSKYISEPDKGIYDAMNKGLKLASGEIISFLNSDDMYFDNTIFCKVLEAFQENNIEALYGDLVYVSRKNKNKIVRYWKTGKLDLRKIKYGWQIPHPAFFISSKVAKELEFDINYRIAADHDFILKALKHAVKCHYVNYPIVKMRFGGKSTENIHNMKNGNSEIMDIIRKNGFDISIGYYFYRPFQRLLQIIRGLYFNVNNRLEEQK
ncbi:MULTISPECIES: glycosyltransferase family 2 protein [unclassified Thermosipho (in: thermotogales)]|uniref:glycosyltransferase family 2 protein n=1 Tax=unclassified Thermosipho (in: thermotogales) TaxID=2676525 RepID=UPI0009D1B80B|nr:glycosyltransferase family 2 protein [Thermosipho sp. 1223]MBT1247051.1 hypothetical protein [Thermosipho sp. 1244]OOC46907.1 hypothetical protein XO09_04290 [Thermosipho sp. 1223]